MTEKKCNFDVDCDDGNVCLISKGQCIPPSRGLIGFEVGDKIYYAKTPEEIEKSIQQLVIVNKLDLDSLRCSTGHDFTGKLPVTNFVGKTFKNLRKQFLELKDEPANLVSIINASDGNILCVPLDKLKRSLKQHFSRKNFTGIIYNKSRPETKEELKNQVISGTRELDVFVNFPYWNDYFILANEDVINNFDTVVYYLVKLTNVEWVEFKPKMSDFGIENDLYMLVPVGDRKFFCNDFTGKCQGLYWDKIQDEPILWKDSYQSPNTCKKLCKKKDTTESFFELVKTNALSSAKKLFAKKGVAINATRNGMTSLHIAVRNDNIEMVSFLLEKGTFINAITADEDDTPLHIAVNDNSKDMVKFLLENKADPNIENGVGETPLYIASGAINNIEIVKMLLLKGAKVNNTKNENSPLYAAIVEENTVIAELLINRGADINIVVNKINNTLLHIVASYKDPITIATLLIDKGININAVNDEGNTALHNAVAADNMVMVKFLFDNKINTDIKNNDGLTALELAVSFGYDEIAKFIDDHKKTEESKASSVKYTDLDILLTGDTSELFRETEFFKNMNNYTRDIDKLGKNSANGFVRKLTYLSNGNVYNVSQKNTVAESADSLVYEYLVGLCINEFAKYYPCFPRTYMVGMYGNKNDWKTLRDLSKSTVLKHDLKSYVKPLNTSDLGSLIKTGCANNRYICIFSQYLPVDSDFGDFMKAMCVSYTRKIDGKYKIRLHKMIAILHIIYSVLFSLAEYFTHYDLHHGNVVLVKAPLGQYFNIKIHLPNGNIVEYKTDYMPVFIDFGHSFIDCKKANNSLNNSNEIMKTVCRYDETNTNKAESVCLNECGNTVGYEWVPKFDYTKQQFFPQNKDNYFINQTRRNASHDLRFLHMIKNNYDFSDVKDGGYIHKTFLTDFFNKLSPMSTDYGTEENTHTGLDKIRNVIIAFYYLNKIVSNPEFDTGNDLLYAGKTPYKTVTMWANGSEFAHKYSVE